MALDAYRYKKNENESADAQFKQAEPYGKIRLGSSRIFWKRGLSWYAVSMEEVTRIYRRIEGVDTKMCCGNVNFDIQKLVLILNDGTELELTIGDGLLWEAEALYRDLKDQWPKIEYGMVK